MTPRVVIFDLDGTLLHSARHVTAATNAALQLARLRPLSDAAVGRYLIGEPLPVLLSHAVLMAGWDDGQMAAMVDAYRAAYGAVRHTPADLYDGVVVVLQRLRAAGVIMAICTNKARVPTQQALADTGLADYFAVVCCGDDPHPAKPDPAPVQYILRHLGVAAADAVMVGDGPHDRTAADAAGVAFCAALWGYGISTDGPSARTPLDILDWVCGARWAQPRDCGK